MGDDWHYHRPLGYFEAKKSVNDLRRFKQLVQHYFHFSVDVTDPDLPDLKKLIPGYVETRQHAQLVREINSMIPIIINRYRRASSPQIFSYEKNHHKRKLDILQDFFQIGEGDWQNRWTIMIESLDRTIGYYRRVVDTFPKAMLNPAYVCAWVLNIPITILAMSGVNVENKKTASIFYWYLQVAMGIIVTLVIVRLGLSVSSVIKMLPTLG